MSKSFKVGDRVGLIKTKNDDDYSYVVSFNVPLRYNKNEDHYEFGVITQVRSDSYLVRWDYNRFNQKYWNHEFHSDALDFEENVKVRITELEQEFESVSNEVKEKVKNISQLLLEANTIAKKTGYSLAEMRDEIRPLLNAMDESGWRTSSFNC